MRRVVVIHLGVVDFEPARGEADEEGVVVSGAERLSESVRPERRTSPPWTTGLT
jgi:hypothetical protein